MFLFSLLAEVLPWISSGSLIVHRSAVGDPSAGDATIMAWALTQGHVVFTHDLDFGTALALTHAGGPSVIQVRRDDKTLLDSPLAGNAELEVEDGLERSHSRQGHRP